MKAVGCVVLVAVLAIGGFFGLAGRLMSRGEDQRALTERVDLTITNALDSGTGVHSGYRFDYAYESDGRWYGRERFVNNGYWSQASPSPRVSTPTTHVRGTMNPDEGGPR